MTLDTEYQKIKAALLKLGPVLPGHLRKVYLRCGKKYCHCQKSSTATFHGPYTFWDRTVGRKPTSRSIPPKHVPIIRRWISNRKKLDYIVYQILQHGVNMVAHLKDEK
jgi:hypothetical protein